MSDTPDSGTSAREARNLGEPYVAEDDFFHLLADDVRTADQSPDHTGRLDNVAGVSSSDPPRGSQNDTGSNVDAQGIVAPRRSSAGIVMTTFSRREVVHFSTCHHLARADDFLSTRLASVSILILWNLDASYTAIFQENVRKNDFCTLVHTALFANRTPW